MLGGYEILRGVVGFDGHYYEEAGKFVDCERGSSESSESS